MNRGLIYLDNAATSWPKPPEVGQAMCDFLAHHAGNPGRGGHRLAREAGEVVEAARTRLAKLVGATCERRVILTHGCTDSVNMAIHGALRAALRRFGAWARPRVVVSATEHNAVLRTVHCYEADGLIDVKVAPCDGCGHVDPIAVANLCTPATVLVCVSHASNAVGTVQDVGAIGRAARERAPESLLLIDAAQTVGHLPIDVERDEIDLLAIAGHKGLRGPTGTGGLYVGPRAFCEREEENRLFCLRRGGTGMTGVGFEMPHELPDALEAGTANAVGLAGLVAALDAWTSDWHDREMAHTARIIGELSDTPGVRVYGRRALEGRTPVVMFSVDGVGPRDVANRLDEQDICLRGGTHCAPLLHEAMGTAPDGAVRASPGAQTTDDEIDRFIEAIRALAPARALA
ncbi:MAG: aminotransferase class V-fold PLP-dependent enzyme [Planctomycetota bacterium]